MALRQTQAARPVHLHGFGSSARSTKASYVTLSLLDDDHQLIASLPRIWNDAVPFLGLTA